MNDETRNVRSSALSIEMSEESDALVQQEGDDDSLLPLQTRILNIVKASPNYTIRPAKLAQDLGISVNDACAELCGLLSAVGEGSTFQFEDINGVKTMVFTFPNDFERRARNQQRREDMAVVLREAFHWILKIIKIGIAFGLILSLLIVTIAGMLAMIAIVVAMSQHQRDSRGGRQHPIFRHQFRNWFFTIRQLLWCYALFGPDHHDSDPFLRDVSYDLWLALSVCCGNPGSLFFWLRADQLRRRQRYRALRGWGRQQREREQAQNVDSSRGVHVFRQGTWGTDGSTTTVPNTSTIALEVEQQRGLLSIAVEFLFGCTTLPGPSDVDKWKLRSFVIVEKCTTNSSISLEELTPYLDSPPSSLSDATKIVSEGLLVVSHFNGIPATTATTSASTTASASTSTTTTTTTASNESTVTKARFIFPELVAEDNNFSTHHDYHSIIQQQQQSQQDYESWEGLFYQVETTTTTPTPIPSSHSHGATPTRPSTTGIPPYLFENRQVFSKLSKQQFLYCVLLGTLNYVGVVWFAQTLDPGGILEPFLGSGVAVALKQTLIRVLLVYAKLFFMVPVVRLLWIMGWNNLRKERNSKRKQLSMALPVVVKESTGTTTIVKDAKLITMHEPS